MDIWDIERIIEMMRRAIENEFHGAYYNDEETGTSERGEVIKTDDYVYITFELWEIPDNFEIEASTLKLQISYLDSFGFKNKKYINLPCPVDPNSLEYTINNGIVDIKLRRIKEKEEEI